MILSSKSRYFRRICYSFILFLSVLLIRKRETGVSLSRAQSGLRNMKINYINFPPSILSVSTKINFLVDIKKVDMDFWQLTFFCVFHGKYKKADKEKPNSSSYPFACFLCHRKFDLRGDVWKMLVEWKDLPNWLDIVDEMNSAGIRK